MKINLRFANIVILAEKHNPTIVSKDWLMDKKIVAEDPTNFIHTPVFSLFESQNFSLIVDENRLQAAPKNFSPSHIDQFKGMVTNYVQRLPETPYKAIGLNYAWETKAEENENALNQWERDFPLGQNRMSALSPAGKYYFGTIIYDFFDNVRLKIVVEPNLNTLRDLSFDLNYHIDIKELKGIVEAIYQFDQRLNHSEKIVNNLCGIG